MVELKFAIATEIQIDKSVYKTVLRKVLRPPEEVFQTTKLIIQFHIHEATWHTSFDHLNSMNKKGITSSQITEQFLGNLKSLSSADFVSEFIRSYFSKSKKTKDTSLRKFSRTKIVLIHQLPISYLSLRFSLLKDLRWLIAED